MFLQLLNLSVTYKRSNIVYMWYAKWKQQNNYWIKIGTRIILFTPDVNTHAYYIQSYYCRDITAVIFLEISRYIPAMLTHRNNHLRQ